MERPLELLVRSQIKILNMIILTNSDLLTNIDYEQFFLEFIDQDADLAVYTISGRNIPYAVLKRMMEL
jgi:hypothetical protein